MHLVSAEVSALRNLEAICSEAGTSLSKALRLTIYLIDLGEFQVVNQVYATFFEAPFPLIVLGAGAAAPMVSRVAG